MSHERTDNGVVDHIRHKRENVNNVQIHVHIDNHENEGQGGQGEEDTSTTSKPKRKRRKRKRKASPTPYPTPISPMNSTYGYNYNYTNYGTNNTYNGHNVTMMYNGTRNGSDYDMNEQHYNRDDYWTTTVEPTGGTRRIPEPTVTDFEDDYHNSSNRMDVQYNERPDKHHKHEKHVIRSDDKK